MSAATQWHRRQTLILASQLPDSTADALMVLEATKELVEYLAEAPPCVAPGTTENVLPFSKG